MDKKKAVVVGVLGLAVAGYFAFGMLTTRAKPADTGAPKTPSAANSITQGANTFFSDSYQWQGKSLVMSEYYAMVKGQWVKQKGSMVLSERNGPITVRRVK